MKKEEQLSDLQLAKLALLKARLYLGKAYDAGSALPAGEYKEIRVASADISDVFDSIQRIIVRNT
jgi:hypothetical protein